MTHHSIAGYITKSAGFAITKVSFVLYLYVEIAAKGGLT